MISMSFAGRIGKDAEQRATHDGTTVVSFSVGCNAGKDKTVWVNCAIFGDRGPKLAPYLKRGTPVAIEGMPSVRAWSDKDREPRADLQCRVGQITLLGSKSDSQSPAPQGGQPVDSPRDLDDEIPF